MIFRPATVCGYAPRQRFDLSVNILTNHAINNNKITVFGGDQMRPNLHILDYCDAVQVLLDAPDEKIANEIFNVGYQNMSIMDIALLVKRVVEQEFPEKAISASSPRRATTSARTTSIPTRSAACSVTRPSARSRRRCATSAAPSRTASFPTRWPTTSTTTSAA